MRELSKTEVRTVSGGADPLTLGLAVILSPFMAVFLQQQAKSAGVPISYFDALGAILGGFFTS